LKIIITFIITTTSNNNNNKHYYSTVTTTTITTTTNLCLCNQQCYNRFKILSYFALWVKRKSNTKLLSILSTNIGHLSNSFTGRFSSKLHQLLCDFVRR